MKTSDTLQLRLTGADGHIEADQVRDEDLKLHSFTNLVIRAIRAYKERLDRFNVWLPTDEREIVWHVPMPFLGILPKEYSSILSPKPPALDPFKQVRDPCEKNCLVPAETPATPKVMLVSQALPLKHKPYAEKQQHPTAPLK